MQSKSAPDNLRVESTGAFAFWGVMPYRILHWDKYQGWKSEQKKRPENAPPYPWLKLHRKTLDSMDFFGIPEPIRWQWFALLCLSDDNGTISENDARIAWRLRIKSFDPKPFINNLLEPISDGVPMEFRSKPDDDPTRREEKREEEIRRDQPHSSAAPKGVRDFDLFWKAFPRKVGKASASKAWRKLNLDAESNKILAAIRRCKDSEQWRKERGQFIPHPATWLNRGGWDDEPDPPKPSPNGNGYAEAHPGICPHCSGNVGAYRDTEGLRLWILCTCGHATQAEVDSMNAELVL